MASMVIEIVQDTESDVASRHSATTSATIMPNALAVLGSTRLVPRPPHRHADPPGPPQLAEAGCEPVEVIAQVDRGDMWRLMQMLLDEGDRADALAERLEATAARCRRGAAVKADQAHHHLEVVSNPVIYFREKGLLLDERVFGMLLGTLAVGDVEARGEVALERPVLGEGAGVVQQPAIGTVMAAQAKLDGVWRARCKGLFDQRRVPVEIVRMQATPPAMTELVVAGPAGEVEPAFVVMDRPALGIGAPHHQRHEIREATEIVARHGLVDVCLGRLCLRGHGAPTLTAARRSPDNIYRRRSTYRTWHRSYGLGLPMHIDR